MAKVEIFDSQGQRNLVVDGVRIPNVEGIEVELTNKKLKFEIPVDEMVINESRLDLNIKGFLIF